MLSVSKNSRSYQRIVDLIINYDLINETRYYVKRKNTINDFHPKVLNHYSPSTWPP